MNRWKGQAATIYTTCVLYYENDDSTFEIRPPMLKTM